MAPSDFTCGYKWALSGCILFKFICSFNSTLTTLDVSGNPMSTAARKAIDVAFVLCLMRNSTVTEINWVNVSGKGFDDQDAIVIGEGLRYVLCVF